MMRRYSLLSVLTLAAVLLGGCGDEPEYPNTLLSGVPANTPYLVASGEPIPEALAAKLRSALQPMIEDMNQGLKMSLHPMEERNPEAARRLTAVAAEVMPLFTSKDGFERAGLSRSDDFVMYGYRMLPVIRIAPSKPKLFQDWVERVFAAAEFTPETMKHQGVEGWFVAQDAVRLVAGMKDGVYSIALTTADRLDQTLNHLFANETIGKSVAETGVLAALRDHYGYLPSSIGYLDFVRLAELLIGDGEGTTGLIAELGGDVPNLTPVCKDEMIALVGNVPRVVWGYDDLDENHMKARWIIELDPTLATEMQGWTAPVPGLGTESDALMTLGYSLKALTAAKSIRGWLTSLSQREFACDTLSQIPWTVFAGTINAAPMYMLGNPKGLLFQLHELDITTLNPQEADLEASFVVLMDSPEAVKKLLAFSVPRIKELQIPDDGEPVALPEELTPGFPLPVYVAMTDHLLGLYVGGESGERLRSVMSASVAEHAPFFQLGLDAEWFYSWMAETMPRIAKDQLVADGPPEAREISKNIGKKMAGWMQALAKVYERASMRVKFTDNGIEMVSEMTLQ